MKPKPPFLGLLLVLTTLVSCYGEPTYPITDKLTVAENEKSIGLLLESVRHLSGWAEQRDRWDDSSNLFLIENALFQDLYQNPHIHIPYTKQILLQRKVNPAIKILLIQLSQCLSVDDYAALGRELLKNPDEKIIEAYLSPGQEFGTILVDHYDHPEIVALLRAYLERFPNSEGQIDRILSGEEMEYLQEIRASEKQYGVRYPTIACGVASQAE